MIAIVGAMLEEIRYVCGQMEMVELASGMNRYFMIGRYHQQDLVTGVTGMGQIASGIVAQYLIDHFPIERIVLIGTAGSLVQHERGHLVEIDRVSCEIDDHHTLILNNNGNGSHLITSCKAICSTEEKLKLADNGYECVDMEGYGVAQAALLNHVPCQIIKVISDSANEEFELDFGHAMEELVDIPAKWVLTTLMTQ